MTDILAVVRFRPGDGGRVLRVVVRSFLLGIVFFQVYGFAVGAEPVASPVQRPRAEVLQEDQPPEPAPVAQRSRELWVDLTWEIHPLLQPEAFSLTTLIPQTIPGRQDVAEVYANFPPEKVFAKGENTYLRWRRERPGTEAFRLMLITRLTLHQYNLEDALAAGQSATPAQTPGFWELRRLKAGERLMEADDPALVAAAGGIPEGDGAVASAREVLGFLRNKLSYEGFVEADRGAAGALRAGGGDCTDYADLFVALCRAKGIPARHLSGVLLGWTATPAHSWAEFFDPVAGWVPVDPLQADLGATEFGRLPPKYIQLSAVRSDPLLENGMLYFWRVSGPGGAKVDFRAAGREESPLQAMPQVVFSRIR